MLKIGREALDGKECSHRCHQKQCFNPRHLQAQKTRNNNDRSGCKYGTRKKCPHGPNHCIWVDLFGEPIPCRNSVLRNCPNLATCTCKSKLNIKYSKLIIIISYSIFLAFKNDVRNVLRPEYAELVRLYELHQEAVDHIVDPSFR